jgi:hypothetical protein
MQSLSLLSDEALLENTRTCAHNERERTALLVAHLAEVFRRDLALKRGYQSIYRYAREELRLSESMAWERVNAARLSIEMPETLDRLARGELTLASGARPRKSFRPGKMSVRASSHLPKTSMRAPSPFQMTNLRCSIGFGICFPTSWARVTRRRCFFGW